MEVDPPQNPNPNPNPAPPAQTRDIRSELAEALSVYPALHAFFESYDGPIKGNDIHLVLPKEVGDKQTTKHFLRVMDWVLEVRDSAFNEAHAQMMSIKEEGEKLVAEEFTTELNKILYTKAMLEGNVYRAVLAGVSKIEEHPNNNQNWPWKIGTEFLAALATKYATHDIVADAENQLTKIAQKDEFAVFNDFLTEFTNLADTANWDNASKVRGFRAKLAPRLSNALTMQVVTPERDDFAGWAEEFRKKLNSTTKGSNGSSGNNGKARDPDTMDLDAIKLASINHKEKERRRTLGLCFKCGQAGHLSRDCQDHGNLSSQSARGGRGGRGSGYQQRGGFGGDYQGHDQGFGRWPEYTMQQSSSGRHQGQSQTAFRGTPARGGYSGRARA
ncbi:hypothetical protein C8A01DRAFT_42065 [Parachaetomium inaequale]|uniref:CCHC-type domain-containing protein n=1 Tax=Parachaetomium inaequale TaxID=2588326 RepID=A0AAN6P4B9_9PEZI|nr:hypothetical protein C8A01DRAFT_42065 [Parachaetomium inaequale]